MASFLNPLLAAGITVISRWRTEAVGWDEPAPVVGKRPRGRPRQKGQAWKRATLPGVDAVTALVVTIYGQAARLGAVWRDMWRRDGTWQVRGVGSATAQRPSWWSAQTSPCRRQAASSGMPRACRWS